MENVLPIRLENLGSFHHLGVAVRDIPASIHSLERLGYQPEGNLFHDRLQGVSGQFVVGSGPRLELLSDLEGHLTVKPWVKLFSVAYHMAYLAEDFEKAVNSALQNGYRILRDARPAEAFQGRRVIFVGQPNTMMIEIIESEGS